MPLCPDDRKFIQAADRLKICVLVTALAVLGLLLLTPSKDIQLATSIIGIALCGVFWLTSRLLSLITLLDQELTRAVATLKRTLPPEQQRQFFSGS